MTEHAATEPATVSSEVEVATDPATAFHAFTEEMDLWWVRGPINFWSEAHRVVAVRCEPGVGGRIVEVLDRPDGDVLVRATITTWEPPTRLGWDSPVDDVVTEVSFTPTEPGRVCRCSTRSPLEATTAAEPPGAGWSPGGSATGCSAATRCPTRWSTSPGCHSVSTTRSRSPPHGSSPRRSASVRWMSCPRPSTTPTWATATTGSSSVWARQR